MGRHRVLVWLLAATGIVSVALLLVALQADIRSTRALKDVNLSGSLRYRSLWIYEAAQKPGTRPSGETQIAAMRGILARLRTHYPEAVGETDPAWNAFSGSLQRTGRIDWQTADAMRLAADTLTHQIETKVSDQNASASLLLRLGLAGLLCALAASGLLLAGLRAAETEVQRALAGLRDSQDLFLQSINAVQEGYMVQNRDGLILLCNAGAERLLGISGEDLPRQSAERPDWRFLRENGEYLPPLQHPGQLALLTAQPQEAVVLGLQRPDVGLIWLSLKAAPVFHTGQTIPYAVVLTFADVTARKKSEEELQKEREFQQALMESLQPGIIACDAAGNVTILNRAMREFYGLPDSPIPLEKWVECADLYQTDGITPLPPQDLPLFRAFNGETVRDAELVIALDGCLQRTITVSSQPIYSPQGQKMGAVAAMYDITDRRQVERELSRLAAIVESSEEAILAMTLDGTLASWNAGAERLYGYAEWEVIGQHASLLAPPGETSLVETVIPRLLQGEFIEPVEVVRRRRDGASLNVSLTFSPIHDSESRVIGLSCIARDVTARRQAENALRESEARLAEAQRIAQIGSWEYDLTENKLLWSSELFRLFGLDPAAGEPDYATAIALYHPEDVPLLDSLVTRAAQEGIGYVLDLRGAPGSLQGSPQKWFHTAGSAVTDDAGRVIRLIGTLVDITERKKLEAEQHDYAERLRRSEEALRAMMSSAPVILYAADAAGTVTLVEGTSFAALGFATSEAVGRSVFEFSCGDPLMEKNIHRALAGETVSCDMRHEEICLHAELRPQYDSCGAVTGIIGVCFDITERAQSEERFRVLFEHSSDAHLLFDDSGIIDCNHAAIALLRCTEKSQMIALHPAVLSPEFQPDGQRSDEKCLAMDAAAREKGYHRFEWVHRKMDGEDFPAEVTLTPVILQGKPVLLVVWHDLTERKKAERELRDYSVILEFQKNQLEETNRKLEALATTDGLTGLKNHRTFQEKLAEEHTRGMRYHQPLSLLLLDVDQFKLYNDSFGHPAGDAVLMGVAAILGRTARNTDIAARYGGEEFVVILPLTDAAGAMVIAERLRTAIAEATWENRPITISVGVCTLSLDTPTPSAMIACADKALYHAKEMGRNRVFQGSLPVSPVLLP